MTETLVTGTKVAIRKIGAEDLAQITPHEYSVSIIEPLGELNDLIRFYESTGLWADESGAVAVIDKNSKRLLGTCHFYRSGPCIHGFEIGYIIHAETDRGNGYASEALGLLSSYLFENFSEINRLQLTIDTTNGASCRVAENAGYLQEGILRRGGFPPEHPDCFIYSRVRDDE